MAYGTKSVTDTATLIVAANCGRKVLSIVNTSTTDDVYIGPDSSITTAIGFLVSAGTTRDMTKSSGGYYIGDLYGIAGTGITVDVRYWEE
jgi:hypothetical protein